MTALPRRRTPALARAKGDLRIYRLCEMCAGTGWHPLIEGELCTHCAGQGRYLVDRISKTRAKHQAYATRDDSYEIHGRQPYD